MTLKKPDELDLDDVRELARLARIAITDEEAIELLADLKRTLGFANALKEVDVSEIEPLAAITFIDAMRMRCDVVIDGNKADDILANAPEREGPFFVVPKVIP